MKRRVTREREEREDQEDSEESGERRDILYITTNIIFSNKSLSSYSL